MMHILPFLSTVVTFTFAGAVFARFLKRRQPHLLIWSIGLIFYGLGTLSEVVLSITFSEAMLKLWYLSGAMLTAAWLGQGTLHLLVKKRRIAVILTGILALISFLSAGIVLSSPILQGAEAYELSTAISSQYKVFLARDNLTIALTIAMNVYGTLTLIGGAIFSAVIFWRKRILFNRMIGNILIAAGAMAPALAGSFVKLGLPDLLYLSELIGVILMFIGFIQATTTTVRETIPATAG